MSGDNKILGGIIGVTVLLVIGLIAFSGNSAGTTTTGLDVEQGELVRDYSPRKGGTGAKVQIVEFGDFQCPACGRVYPLIEQAIAEYGDQVEFVWRDFPLMSIHPNSLPAARAAAAARNQGKFWEMYERIFTNQSEWSSKADATDTFAGYAATLGLDTAQFQAAVASETLLDQIRTDIGDGDALGVDSTPTFYVNGVQIDSFVSYEALKGVIDVALTQ